jgi:catechol 2,3-dioxygenase-like lactoylglutathione lyase family enzyme
MKSKAKKTSFHTLLMALMSVATLATVSSAAQAQSAGAKTPAGPRAVGVSILHLNISNLDQSLALYRDVLGMQPKTPLSPARSAPNLLSEPGAMLRTAILNVPGGTFEFELVEWSGIPVKPQQARIQDPGAVMLAMTVRDIDTLLAGIQKLGLKVLTSGGKPVAGERDGKPTRSIVVRDRDGFAVELVEVGKAAAAGAAAGQISNVSVYLTVQDLAQTATFYNKAFGFNIAAPGKAGPTSEHIQTLLGDKSLATVRMTKGTFPGSEFTINFQEFPGSDHKPVQHRVQDPGGPLLIVFVQEFPAVMNLIRENGGIIGSGASSEALKADAKSGWARDPNGLLMMVTPPGSMGPPPGAPTAAAPARP